MVPLLMDSQTKNSPGSCRYEMTSPSGAAMEMHNSSPCRSSGESLEFASSGRTIRNYGREELTDVLQGAWDKSHEWSFPAIRITSRGE